MDQQTILMAIVGMALVTYIPRMVPLLALSSRNLNPTVQRFLSFVPTAVLSAMLLPSLVLDGGKLDFTLDNFFLWAAIPTFFVAWRTKSFFGAVIAGMALVALARLSLS